MKSGSSTSRRRGFGPESCWGSFGKFPMWHGFVSSPLRPTKGWRSRRCRRPWPQRSTRLRTRGFSRCFSRAGALESMGPPPTAEQKPDVVLQESPKWQAEQAAAQGTSPQ
eukprot:1539927-Amphidinium_carterae.1